MLILPAQAATSGRACKNPLRQVACQTNMRKKNTVARTPSTTSRAIPGAGRRVTSYDVALLAGVSQSAVSRCFKPGASISQATHAKVMQAAISLDYIPNAAARSLITRRSNLVAVIISNLANLYYPQVLSDLSQQIARQGKRLLLFTLEREADIGKVLNDVWQYQVDGAVVAACLSDEQMAEFGRRDVPLVLFNRSPANTPCMRCCATRAKRRACSSDRQAATTAPSTWYCHTSLKTLPMSASRSRVNSNKRLPWRAICWLRSDNTCG